MSRPTIRVLYIDDEKHNLEAFKASYRRDFEIYTAISAKDGLKVLENVNIQIIIADQKMPDVTGAQFFKSIAATYPDPIRILLTGYTDLEGLTEAINYGDIYRYMTKPWDDREIQYTVRNAHEAYQAKIDLRNKIAELEKTNDELNRFIYSISHELRAPMVSIGGIVNLVKMENLFESTGDYWAMVETCTNKLDYYIQKTLQYYKNNKSVAENIEVNFNKLVPELINLYADNDKETNFKVNIDAEIPFIGDAFRIEVILGNLISNAIKYQKENEKNKKVNITIKVSKQLAEITIQDNGIGILNEHLEKIFAQFFKSRTYHGSGLGLFIVKEALGKINGKISVNSDEIIGTIFKITIPNAQ